MPATRRLDGIAVSRHLRAELGPRLAALPFRAGLAVIVVGDHAASAVYVRNKIRACDEAGIHSELIHLPASITESALLAEIDRLNRDTHIHAILVQLPLPEHVAAHKVVDAIAPAKDVDGFHLHNLGALAAGRPGLIACTPAGIMALLEFEKIDVRGRRAVVVGASNLVGKPTALLLLQKGATVTICNSKTRDLGAITREAEILVVAVGRARLINADMIRPGAIVIDVGINRTADGKLVGDVDFDGAQGIASAITPVPGGVGPMTITSLLKNTVVAAENYAALK